MAIAQCTNKHLQLSLCGSIFWLCPALRPSTTLQKHNDGAHWARNQNLTKKSVQNTSGYRYTNVMYNQNQLFGYSTVDPKHKFISNIWKTISI